MKVDKSKWGRKTLKDIGIIVSGATPRTDDPLNWGDKYNWVTPAELKGEKYIGRTQKQITDHALSKTKLTLMPPGTVLLSSRAPIGKVAITTEPMYCNQGFKNIVCGNKFFNGFLYYYLIANQKELNRRGNGVTFKEISKKNVEAFPVIVPSLYEQQAIASELDAVQEMIDGYKAQLADLDALAQSIFLDMFGDPITNPKGWKMNKVSDLSMKMSTGPFGSMLHKSDYTVDGIPSINPQNINNRKIITDDIAKISYQKAEELSKYIVRTNNIIIARRGDLSKCAIITDKEDGWLCGTGSFMLELKNILPILFYYQYTSQSVQKFLNDKCIGATMPNLNQKILGGLKLIVPPLSLQQHFASQVEAIEKQKDLLREQLKDAETLMAERMQYYFS